ncbi:MAG: phosphoribosylaminoimidazolesuccinocarboxamide synthase [candidate division WOR-3 bacterium]|jgi:phosphoribosylaminoimidazole-succinocarboxamide synthase
MNLMYEGKSKKVYKLSDNEVILEFKDSATAFNAQKFEIFEGKGKLNAKFSAFFFNLLKENGVENHFLRVLDENKIICKNLEIIKLEVVIRNIATGSIVKRLGISEGFVFNEPLIEFFYKEDKLNDPLICKEHVKLLNLASEEEIEVIKNLSLKANDVLKQFFEKFNLRLVDIKFEFGKFENKIFLADEISPDIFRVWDENGNSYDKDVFRFNKGNLIEVYSALAKKINLI